MPYIRRDLRTSLDPILQVLIVEIETLAPKESSTNPAVFLSFVCGILNYIITRLLLSVMKLTKESYAYHNMVLGVLTGVTQEWYRRKVSIYEDGAIERNGDL